MQSLGSSSVTTGGGAGGGTEPPPLAPEGSGRPGGTPPRGGTAAKPGPGPCPARCRAPVLRSSRPPPAWPRSPGALQAGRGPAKPRGPGTPRAPGALPLPAGAASSCGRSAARQPGALTWKRFFTQIFFMLLQSPGGPAPAAQARQDARPLPAGGRGSARRGAGAPPSILPGGSRARPRERKGLARSGSREGWGSEHEASLERSSLHPSPACLRLRLPAGPGTQRRRRGPGGAQVAGGEGHTRPAPPSRPPLSPLPCSVPCRAAAPCPTALGSLPALLRSAPWGAAHAGAPTRTPTQIMSTHRPRCARRQASSGAQPRAAQHPPSPPPTGVSTRPLSTLWVWVPALLSVPRGPTPPLRALPSPARQVPAEAAKFPAQQPALLLPPTAGPPWGRGWSLPVPVLLTCPPGRSPPVPRCRRASRTPGRTAALLPAPASQREAFHGFIITCKLASTKGAVYTTFLTAPRSQ